MYMSEKENPELETWGEATKNVNKERSIIRKCGTHNYEIVIHEINGDVYEDLAIDARLSTQDQKQFLKKVAYMLREKSLKTVMGKKYEMKMDREMPVWLRKDLDDFYIEYIGGNI